MLFWKRIPIWNVVAWGASTKKQEDPSSMRRSPSLQGQLGEGSKDELAREADCAPRAEADADAKGAGMREATPHTGTLIHAIRLDLLAFGRHLALLLALAFANLRRSSARGEKKRTQTRGPWRGGLIVPMLTGLVVAPLVIMAVITAGILWALHDTPIAGKAEPSKQPPLLLEAADGRPLGRTGPLIDAAARSGFS